MQSTLPVVGNAIQRLSIQHFTPARNVMCGIGLAFAIEKEKYWHLPVAFIFPSVYCGYQGYKNRAAISGFLGL